MEQAKVAFLELLVEDMTKQVKHLEEMNKDFALRLRHQHSNSNISFPKLEPAPKLESEQDTQKLALIEPVLVVPKLEAPQRFSQVEPPAKSDDPKIEPAATMQELQDLEFPSFNTQELDFGPKLGPTPPPQLRPHNHHNNCAPHNHHNNCAKHNCHSNPFNNSNNHHNSNCTHHYLSPPQPKLYWSPKKSSPPIATPQDVQQATQKLAEIQMQLAKLDTHKLDTTDLEEVENFSELLRLRKVLQSEGVLLTPELQMNISLCFIKYTVDKFRIVVQLYK